MPAYEIAALTHAGHHRPTNEDFVLVDGESGLAVVADGMGGEAGGELASVAACRAIGDVTRAAPGDVPALEAALAAAATAVANGIGGATVAAVRLVVGEAIVEIAHVGDVRVYLLRRTTANALPAASPRYCPPVHRPSGSVLVGTTRDHTSLCELVERGHIDREAAARHPLRGRVSRALGREDSRADVQLLQLVAGDRILVCSDGLWSLVDGDAIARVLDESATAESACKQLVAAALAKGGKDNIGVAVAFWSGEAARPRVVEDPPPVATPPAAPRAEDELPRALRDRGRDLTRAARRGELEPTFGRDREVLDLARAILQRRKASAILVGEAGVGKTSIVEALARRIAAGDVKPELARLRIFELSLTELIAGTSTRGQLEQRTAEILEAAEADPDLVLFVDEIHVLGAGGETPYATIAAALKPALARGLRVIGATTTAEYDRQFARDDALARRFDVLRVAEPDHATTLMMLRGLRESQQRHYRVTIDDGALEAAIELSIRYLPDRRLPDKAVDLVERACGLSRFDTLSQRAGEPSRAIGRRDVAAVIADRLGLAIEVVERDAAAVLASVERGLRGRVRCQDAAVDAIAAALRRAHGPARDARRPVTSMLFAGPTGVGKTSAAQAIAELLYGRGALVRIDMSEYNEPHTVARLLGAPPGYVGHELEGQLTGPVRRRPAVVVLLDEIEKAHREIWMLLLQVLGDGELTDARGRTVSFREAIVVLTTNLSLEQQRAAGFLDRGAPDDVRHVLAAKLPPELVGRIEHVVSFRAFEPEDRAEIVEVVVERLEARLRAQGVTPPPGHVVRQRVHERLPGLQLGVRSVEGLASEVVTELLDTPAPERGAVVLDTIRTRVQVAMLLIDIVGSSAYLADAGETRYVSIVRHLVDALRCHPASVELQFLKCTGDGVLALYSTVEAAFQVGHDLQSVRDVMLRRVVHFGRVRHGPVGDFLGVEMHRIFRIEAVDAEDRVGDGPRLPRAPFLLSDDARDQLPSALRDRTISAGTFELSGFPDPVVLWTVPSKEAS